MDGMQPNGGGLPMFGSPQGMVPAADTGFEDEFMGITTHPYMNSVYHVGDSHHPQQQQPFFATTGHHTTAMRQDADQYGVKRHYGTADLQDFHHNPHTTTQQDLKRQRKDDKKVNSENWDAMYSRLLTYRAEHGDCLVPKRYASDSKLGTWVETQRVQYKKLERSVDLQTGVEVVIPNKRLTMERLERLNTVGFAWTAKNVKAGEKLQEKTAPATGKKSAGLNETSKQFEDEQWDEMFRRLAVFRHNHGHCLVSRKDEPRLGAWVEQQRTSWNRQNRELQGLSASLPGALSHSLPDEHIPVGDYDWNLEPTAALAQVANHDDQHDYLANKTGGGDKILSAERIEKLNTLGFVWSLRNKRVDDHWEIMFEKLIEYKDANGDCLVPSRWEPNQRLGKWVETQRYEYGKQQRSTNDISYEGGDGGDQKPRVNSSRLSEDRIRRLESIGFEWKVKNKMKKYYDKQWDKMFEQLLEFKEKHGHCMVPKRYPPNPQLGGWTHTQRIQYRRKATDGKASKAVAVDSDSAEELNSGVEEDIVFRLTDDRLRRLEEVGFVWSPRESDKIPEQGQPLRHTYNDQWDGMFNRLCAFKEKNGHCLVPKRYKEDKQLGTWVDTQRVQHRKLAKIKAEAQEPLPMPGAASRSSSDASASSGANGGVDAVAAAVAEAPKSTTGRLTEERIRRLEDIGFVWSLRDDWNKHYEELQVFRKEHGHCNVPARYSKNRRLGIWVSAQRQQYKAIHAAADVQKARRAAPLTKERIDLLNQIGFTWTIRSRDTLGEGWSLRLQQLAEYRHNYGDTNVPYLWAPNPELGVFVATQRNQYCSYMDAKQSGAPIPLECGGMNADRIRLLEDLGFVWDVSGEAAAMLGHNDSEYYDKLLPQVGAGRSQQPPGYTTEIAII